MRSWSPLADYYLTYALGVALVLLLLAAVAYTVYPVAASFLDALDPAPLAEQSFLDPNSGQTQAWPSLFDPPTLDLTVVVPAYNEEERLPRMLDEALAFLSSSQASSPTGEPLSFEIIVADDGSSDSTAVVALAYAEKIGRAHV